MISQLIKSISPKERKFLGIMILVMVIITIIPYLYGYLNTPEGKYYTGIHFLTPGDINVYYSYIEQVKQGHLFFQDLFTSEPQARILFFPDWYLPGFLSKIFNLSNPLAYQLMRVILIPIFLVLAYLFIAYLFEDKVKRKMTFLFLASSSGLGGLLVPILAPFRYLSDVRGYYHWPMDLWVPESNTFLTLFHSPRLILSLILIILIFFLMLLSFESRKVSYSFGAGLAALLLFFFHPFHVPTIFIVLLVFIFIICIRERKVKTDYLIHYLILLFISSPALLYHFLLLKLDPMAIQKASQNILLTPAWWLTLISYGLLFILALGGSYLFLKQKNNKFLFMVIWMVIQFCLLYSPLFFQRRLSEGLHFPIVILAVEGLYFFFRYLNQKMKIQDLFQFKSFLIAILAIFITFFGSSNLAILLDDIVLYSRADYPYFYLDQELKEALGWLKNNLSENEVVVASPPSGNFIPGFSGRITYIGHGVETLYYKKKESQVEWLYQDDKEAAQKAQFLKGNQIDYLFWGPHEKNKGSFNPETKDFLQEVYQNSLVKIYKVL